MLIGWKRSSYIITTKIYWGGTTENEKGLSRKHIIEGLQYSLTRLGLEYVDIVFANRNDPNVPMEEIVRAFSYCIEKGMHGVEKRQKHRTFSKKNFA